MKKFVIEYFTKGFFFNLTFCAALWIPAFAGMTVLAALPDPVPT